MVSDGLGSEEDSLYQSQKRCKETGQFHTVARTGASVTKVSLVSARNSSWIKSWIGRDSTGVATVGRVGDLGRSGDRLLTKVVIDPNKLNGLLSA